MKKEYKIDKCIFKLIDKRFYELILILLFIISVMIRVYSAPFTEISTDYTGCIYYWVLAYREKGFFGGLGQTIGNYYVPYNLLLALISKFPWQPWFLVALTSSCADVLCAYMTYKIALQIWKGTIHEEKKIRAAFVGIIMMYIPCILLNGALWKQCDSIYVSFVLVSIYLVLREKYTVSFLWLSLAFVFKMQAIFILPLFIYIYISKRKFSILQFLWIPCMYLVWGIPAILCGRGVWDTYGVYLGQASEGASMMTNTTNIYEFGMVDPEVCGKFAIVFTMFAFLIMMAVVFKYSNNLNKMNLLMLSGWVAWTCYMFLPHMRQRYDFMAVVLVTMFVLICDIRYAGIAIIMNVTSWIMYSRYLFGYAGISIIVTTVFYCIAYVCFTAGVVYKLRNKGLIDGEKETVRV